VEWKPYQLATTQIYSHIVDEELEGALKSFRTSEGHSIRSAARRVQAIDEIRGIVLVDNRARITRRVCTILFVVGHVREVHR